MELKLKSLPEYDRYIQQLGDIQVYKSIPFGDRWFDNIEEARQATLHYFQSEFRSYKRDCSGRRHALRVIIALGGQ